MTPWWYVTAHVAAELMLSHFDNYTVWQFSAYAAAPITSRMHTCMYTWWVEVAT